MTTRDMNISLTIPVFRSSGGSDLSGYTLVREQKWDALSTYFGNYKLVTCTLQGPPEQIAPVSMASKIIEIYVEKFKSGGWSPLGIKIYADWSPTLKTSYKVEFKIYEPTATTSLAQANMHAVQAVAAVIAVIVVALAVIAISVAVWKVADVSGSAIEKTGSAGIWAVLVIAGIVAWGWTSKKTKKAQKEGSA